MADALALINTALGKIGQSPLTTVGDSGHVGSTCRLLFVPAIHSLVAPGEWSFARSRAHLALASDQTPADLTDFEYAYDLPADYLAMLEFHPTGDEYIIEGRTLFCDVELDAENLLPRIVYVRTVAEIDAIMQVPTIAAGITLPASFESAFTTYFASLLVMPIAKDPRREQTLNSRYLFELQQADGVDTIEQKNPGEGRRFWSEEA